MQKSLFRGYRSMGEKMIRFILAARKKAQLGKEDREARLF